MIHIKKLIIPLTLGAISVGTLASFYLIKSRKKINTEELTVAKAAFPDQLDIYEDDHFENTKMMSEGSHYGIDYYNEIREDS